MQRIYWPAEGLLAYQRGLCCVEFSYLRDTVIWPAQCHCLGCDTVKCGRSSPTYNLQLCPPLSPVHRYQTACHHNPEDNNFQSDHCDDIQCAGWPLFSCLFNTFVLTHHLHPMESRRTKLYTNLITIQLFMHYCTYHNWVTSLAIGHCGHTLLCLCMHRVTLSLDNIHSPVCWSNSWKLYITENISHKRSQSCFNYWQGKVTRSQTNLTHCHLVQCKSHKVNTGNEPGVVTQMMVPSQNFLSYNDWIRHQWVSSVSIGSRLLVGLLRNCGAFDFMNKNYSSLQHTNQLWSLQ